LAGRRGAVNPARADPEAGLRVGRKGSAARPRIVVGQGSTTGGSTVVSWWRYLGCLIGFGFGVMWMTEGLGAAVLTLLCAALGCGFALAVEHERAGLRRLRPATQARPAEDEPLLRDELELEHYERYDEEVAVPERAPVGAEVEYGWPVPKEG
jgi:hypothetical protein